MRIALLAFLCVSLTACGGGVSDGGADGTTGATTPPGSSTTNPPGTAPPQTETNLPKTVGAECSNPTAVLVPSGGTIARPASKGIKIELVYQGATIGVTDVREREIIPGTSSTDVFGPDTSGYWLEGRTAGKMTFQRSFRDPTNQEAFGPPPGVGGGFTNTTIPRCDAKSIQVEAPNDASVTELVVFGSPYGTQERAVELARFSIK